MTKEYESMICEARCHEALDRANAAELEARQVRIPPDYVTDLSPLWVACNDAAQRRGQMDRRHAEERAALEREIANLFREAGQATSRGVRHG